MAKRAGRNTCKLDTFNDYIKNIPALILLVISIWTFINNLLQTQKNITDIERLKVRIETLKNENLKLELNKINNTDIKDGKTLLEQGLGTKNGRIAKGELSGWGTAGSINSLLEHGFKITTVTDAVGGALDAKTTADNAMKYTSNGN